MTEGFDVQVQPVQAQFGQSMEGDYVTQATAGATGAKSATAAGSGGDSDVGAAHILALRPLVVVAVPQLYYIHADHLNTPRLITDASQQVVWRNDQTEPFDSNPPDENPSGLGLYEFPLRDDGTYFAKETGLLYNWNRYRDNSGGRFLQADPLGVRNRDLSLYVLRRNNPLRYTDPDGLDVSADCRPLGTNPRRARWMEARCETIRVRRRTTTTRRSRRNGRTAIAITRRTFSSVSMTRRRHSLTAGQAPTATPLRRIWSLPLHSVRTGRQMLRRMPLVHSQCGREGFNEKRSMGLRCGPGGGAVAAVHR